MSFAKLLAVLLLLPMTVHAADLPWSVDVDAGLAMTRTTLSRDGLYERRGSRELLALDETVDEGPALLVGISPSWRIGEHLAVFGHAEWQRSQNVALHGEYAFWNGDFSTLDDSIDRLDTTRAAVGVRWSVPVAGCWSVGVSGDVRSMDIRQTQDATIFQLTGSGQVTAMPQVFSQSRSAAGLGAGANLACRLNDRWSVSGAFDYGRLEDYSVLDTSLALRFHLR